MTSPFGSPQYPFDFESKRLLDLIKADAALTSSDDVIITRKSLANLSGELNLSSQELDIIFSALDSDDDGVITAKDIRLQVKREQKREEEIRQPNVKASTTDLTVDFDGLSEESQELVCDLYQQLHSSGNPEILDNFESVILGVLKDIRQYQMETEGLAKSFKREKEQHERHLRQLEEEMEVQMQKVEDKVRQEEREKTENEKMEMRAKVEEEIKMLQLNLTRLQQEGPEARNKEIEEQLLALRGKVEEMTFANRQLKSELTDAQTNLALLKSELAATQQAHKEKIHEFNLEKQANADYQREHENLTRQLELLHDANKKLHDTNDDLREALDTSRRASPLRQMSVGSAVSSLHSLPNDRRGSVLSEYFHHGAVTRPRTLLLSTSSLAEEDGDSSTWPESMMENRRPLQVKILHQDTCEEDSVVDDIDSGHSTLREGYDQDHENHFSDVEVERRLPNRRLRRFKPGQIIQSEEQESHDEIETETESHGDMQMEHKLYRGLEYRRPGSSSSRSSSRSSRSREGRDSAFGRSVKRQSTLTQDSTASRMSKEPDRMFKVVLAGDAAVGKTSLIMRLCKGKFVNNLSSTLGVDFQTKIIELDGRTVALQLWDTAGQERFRSIAKSYFRRADGVLLLYDCTYERSFINVRDWVESIESSQESTMKKLPIMLCANKTDLRQELIQQGRKVVTYEDGQRLARDFKALFIETSAKDGSNITESVTELARTMRANEDLEVKTVGLQLHDPSKQKSGCCGR
ncbi:hypothetical protein CHS0354_022199 [Potamilus streckersoni]|uniref:EF-hand domain-containing protein n=1 Tax=Potamilus streckersoni TaxID=2493646 RepID=A0AAE0TIG8_9BIVA|nr:hypothetical protein CHS0354_022199 [Potamilus streckersoni]